MAFGNERWLRLFFPRYRYASQAYQNGFLRFLFPISQGDGDGIAVVFNRLVVVSLIFVYGAEIQK